VTTTAWGALGMWVLVGLAVYCAALETGVLLGYRGIRADVDSSVEWTERQVAALHARLDNMGAPGTHPTTPPARTATYSHGGPVYVDPTPTVVFESTPLADAVSSTDAVVADLRSTLGLPDRPTAAQQAEPTRPDFRAQPIPARDRPAVPAPTGGRHRSTEA
jgi:hypothetical protein